MMEHLEQVETVRSSEKVVSSPLQEAESYKNKLEERTHSLMVQAESIEDPEVRKTFKARIERASVIGRRAIAGSMFMLAAHGAFAQEIPNPDTDAPMQPPSVSASFDTNKIVEEVPEEKKVEIVQTSLQVAGEALQTEAEKISPQEREEQVSAVIELPLGAGKIDLSDPATLAKLASKAGGTVGNLGKLAVYAHNSYEKLQESKDDKENKELSLDARKTVDLVASLPIANPLSNIARLAGIAMDSKEKIDKGEKITAEEVFQTAISFVPHAAILMTGINLLKKLPHQEAPAVPQEELTRF